MLYPKKEEPFQESLFRSPTSEYRGAPFWAWNCAMTEEMVDATIRDLREMGMGGAHIHPRTGLDTPYLSDEFMALVKRAVAAGKENGMLTWLYDEDRWPSGYGGGLVTSDHAYRNRYLVFAPYRLDQCETNTIYISSAMPARSKERTLLGRYGVFIERGCLEDYCLLQKEEELPEGWQEWFAYLEVSGDSPWFNNQAYVNTLDQRAVEKFIEVTHERYYQTAGDEFGKSIPAIFTDEPQFCHKDHLGFAEESREVIIPFTDDFDDTFIEAYGYSLMEKLPELFWELPKGRVSVSRYRYHDHLCERFVRAYADTIGAWCREHKILLTGHMMEEPTLMSQTAALGEAMRSYRGFDLPGIDMLCDWRELSTAKQAQSAARQNGSVGVLSEIYGVTNWDFDFRGHKLAGDWQAALGVTVRVHHLNWTTMAGEAKRDYPAPIGYQSPWYRQYRLVEDHFARLNTVLTRGKAIAKIGVIHPIESYWLYFGTEEMTGGIRREMEDDFNTLIEWLLFGLQDFDFIAESLLPIQTAVPDITGRAMPVGEMAYQVILVPNCRTLRRTTLERLERFKELGGRIIFAGTLPTMVEAVPSQRVQSFADSCEHVEFRQTQILDALEQERLLEVRKSSGMRTDNLIGQLRQDGVEQWLFLSRVYKMKNPDLPVGESVTISVKGEWLVSRYNTLTGERLAEETVWKQGRTELSKTLYEHDSLLLRLQPLSEKREEESEERSGKELCAIKPTDTPQAGDEKEIVLPGLMRYTLSEPNVLVLDMAEYRLDQGEWRPREEILRIDNRMRRELGYPQRIEAFAQPWLQTGENSFPHTLSLRYHIYSDVSLTKVSLALEDAEEVEVYWNNLKVREMPDGYYVDRAIRTISLPGVRQGENILTVEIPYSSRRNLEAMYLIGDFGVRTGGSEAGLTALPKEIGFGDITRQGFPFYGGNVTYHARISTPKGRLEAQISRFRSPLLELGLDGEVKGYIAFSPYRVDIGEVEEGRHILDITFYGNRVNTFGAIHNCNETEQWYGPNAWRTVNEQWSYEYCLKPTGILKAPELTVKMHENQDTDKQAN